MEAESGQSVEESDQSVLLKSLEKFVHNYIHFLGLLKLFSTR